MTPEVGNPLLHACDFSTKGVLPELSECTITIASDVMNPFYGPQGAAFVFAGQKGATIQETIELDDHLKRFADLVEKKLGINLQAISGAGAASGLGGAFAGCTIQMQKKK